MKKSYKAIIFDLFDTIVDFHYSKLPVVQINGTQVNTTSSAVFGVFSAQFNGFDYHKFHEVFIDSYRQSEEIKKADHREYPSHNRFNLMLRDLGIEPGSHTTQLVEEMVLTHMHHLRRAVTMPAENRETLEYYNVTHRLGLLSNFDHSPSAVSLIDEYDLKNFFDSIIISVDTGWRKPKRLLFEQSFDELGVSPDEAIFVGDNFEADIAGAKAAGMDTVWIKSERIEPESDLSCADFVIESLPGLLKIV